MRDFLFDLRSAVRTLRLNPGFATVAIVTPATMRGTWSRSCLG